MKQRLSNYPSIAVAIIILGLLLWRTWITPPAPALLLPISLFLLLTIFTNTLGVPLGGGRVSLLPMTAVSTYLVFGLVPAVWVAFLGALCLELIRYGWAEQLKMRREPDLLSVGGLAAANAIIQTASILTAGIAFQAAGGTVPLSTVHLAEVPLLLLAGATYLGTNLLVAGFYIAVRSRSALKLYLRSLPNLLFYEGSPLVFAPLVAAVYLRLGIVHFFLFALILIVASLITFSLANASQRLERRVKELASLQEVGQTLSASLDLDTILAAIHTQLNRLMPAHNCYIALYHPETDEVSFPLAIEDGQRVYWSTRRAGKGLTEYLLRTRRPLLIQKELDVALREIGVEQIGRPAVSWLGVPILAGAEPLGTIAVQSFTPDETYDSSQQEVLVTIAAQAAVAIQNARLYAQTDKALARRVQELDSLLRTTSEGMLLFDRDWLVIAVNRALADLVGRGQAEMAGQSLLAPATGTSRSLAASLGYLDGQLQADCESLAAGNGPNKRQKLVLSSSEERPVERTLTPVHDRDGAIIGWLVVLRDLTEEREIERLREDMTHLLIHDLRSPLTVMKGSLELVGSLATTPERPDLDNLIAMARRGNEQMLGLVNQLLDVNRLEGNQMPVHAEAVDVKLLLEEVAGHFVPLASQAAISVQTEVSPELSTVPMDRALIGRVLSNLVDNAIKFLADGGTVRLWARPGPEAMLLGVSDNGPGIPPAAQAELFKKYRQVSGAAGRRQGTGLGLYFCKLAVEAHGGQIGVESSQQGSTFTIRLPLGTITPHSTAAPAPGAPPHSP